jgi:hypothetical protein
MTKLTRSTLYSIHVLAVLSGGALAIWGIVYTVDLLGHEALPLALHRAIPSLALLALSIAYLTIVYQRGFCPIALPAYTVSYLLVGGILDMTITGMMKGFPPGDSSQAAAAYLLSICLMANVGIGTVIGARTVYRRSEGSLARPNKT